MSSLFTATRSWVCLLVERSFNKPCRCAWMHGVGHDSLVHKRYALSAWKSMKACMRREIILVYRHSFVYLFRIAQVCLGLSVWLAGIILLCRQISTA